MDDIDKLLAGIESKPLVKPVNLPIEATKPLVTTSIEDLLGGLEESVKRNVRQQLSLHPHPPVVPNQLVMPSQPVGPIGAASIPPSMEAMLGQVKAAQDQKAQAELAQQQEIEQERQRQAQLKQQRLEQLKTQRREELRHNAQNWLNKLPPKSEEGQWFAEFACNYDSRLEAAIDYLEALQEVNDMLPKR
jgi:hypothetical protein